MAFRPFGIQYFPGFVMNESVLFFEAAQSEPRQNGIINCGARNRWFELLIDKSASLPTQSMGFKPYGPQYFPGFVMNESKLFFEAEQSDLPRQQTNYCLHVDGMALMKQFGLRLIREWNMPMEIRPVWVGDRRCMYAWLLPRNYGTTLFLDADFQARLAEFKKVARIPGPPNEQPRWLALHTGDIPHTFVQGQRWADEKYRSQSIQETLMYTKSCANCDLFDPPVYERGGEEDDESSGDDGEEESDPDAEDDSEEAKNTEEDAIAGDKGVTSPAKLLV
ncbi:hypothetical protein PTI98_000089 [Pleurotus ostreatus]|nr:hypothetical protein PTI98_000089 [Pleurotus ostreatus]